MIWCHLEDFVVPGQTSRSKKTPLECVIHDMHYLGARAEWTWDRIEWNGVPVYTGNCFVGNYPTHAIMEKRKLK